MNIKRIRSGLNSLKVLFFILVWQSAFSDIVNHGKGRVPWWLYWGPILLYFLLLVLMGRRRKADQSLLRILAWEKQAALRPLLTMFLLYGIFLILTLPPFFLLMFTGNISPAEWPHWFGLQIVSCGIFAVMYRVCVWLFMPT
jgi:hypothetical protein